MLSDVVRRDPVFYSKNIQKSYIQNAPAMATCFKFNKKGFTKSVRAKVICLKEELQMCLEWCYAIPPDDTVGFHNFNLRIFNFRVSNPNKLIVDVFLTRCRISICQGLGPNKHDDISEIDRIGWRLTPSEKPKSTRRRNQTAMVRFRANYITLHYIRSYIIFYYLILYYIILYYIILYHIMRFDSARGSCRCRKSGRPRITLHYIRLYSIILYYIILYSTIFYYTILYYIILCYLILYYAIRLRPPACQCHYYYYDY